MPFIIQCPYPECAKFMLLEDSDRGSTVKCLVCKKPIKLDPSNSGENAGAMGVSPSLSSAAPSSPAAAKPPVSSGAPAAAAPAQRQTVRTCTKCNTPLKVPAGAEKQRIRCPKCQNVF